MQERDIFLNALEFDNVDDRNAFLDQACAGNTRLRERVEALIRADAVSEGFLRTPVDLPTTATIPKRVGPFELQDTVGRGGMGMVYRAWDSRLERYVAIKLLQGQVASDAAAAARFRHEARVTARLAHPGVPPVHEVGELPDGRPYLAMKLVEGRTLHALLADRSQPERDRARRIADFEHVCQAVGYAHSRGVIHRDLKPANIMVGAFGEVQVMDWGLAKLLRDGELVHSVEPPVLSRATSGSNAHGETVAFWDMGENTPHLKEGDGTHAGAVLGTPGYMAPEQARGDAADCRSDVFGLGAVLCEILTGVPPFNGPTPLETLQSNATGDVTIARGLLARCGADPELIDLCERCLQPNPADRPADAVVMAAELASWRANTDERSRLAEVDRAESAVRVRELRKRRGVWLGLAVVSVLGFAVSLGLAIWADQARRTAETAQKLEMDARARAEDETQLANGVKDFMKFDLLQLADPIKQKRDRKLPFDANVKLRDVLIRAATVIDGKFPDRPLVDAELRYTIGNTLSATGKHDMAVGQYEQAAALFKSTVGEDHPDYLRSLFSLSNSLEFLGRRKESLAIREMLVPKMRQVLGEDDRSTLIASHMLAVSYSALGRAEEGRVLAESTLARQRQKLGDDHEETLDGMLSTAKTYTATNRMSDALKIREEALRGMRQLLGEDDPRTQGAIHDLAVSYGRQGRYLDARSMFEKHLKYAMQSYGPDHVYTLGTLSNLAQCDVYMGNHVEGLARRQELLTHLTRINGNLHPETLLCAQHVIDSLIALNRIDEAWTQIDPLYELALKAESQGKTLRWSLKQDLLAHRLEVCRERKDIAGVRRTAELLRQLPTQSAVVANTLTGCHAVLAGLLKDKPAEARVEADLAMERLLKAWSTATVPWDRGVVGSNRNFAALRDRDDFRKLLASLRYTAPLPRTPTLKSASSQAQ